MQAKLIIQNEVSCKITGLELGTRKKLVDMFKYEVPGARYLPAVRLGRWDGRVAFFQLGGSTYVNLLPEIIPVLDAEGYDIDVEDLREYRTNFEFSEFSEDMFATSTWPEGHPLAGESIMFRDYQVEIINNFLKNPQSVQEVATGAGKCLSTDTELIINIDENAPFSKFLIDKLQQKMMQLKISIGKLAEYIEEFNAALLVDNQEISVEDFGIEVPTLDGNAKVNHFIKKFNLPMVKLEFDNGYSIRVAENHILRRHERDIFAKELNIGDSVDHLTGTITVTKKIDIGNEDCFDISIDAPHLYYDANGLIHHNTIMTAALSRMVEIYGRSIVIVPNKSLITQTEEDYRNLGLDVGVYFGDRKEWGHRHTICTWQSLNVLLKNTKSGTVDCTISEFIENVVCVIIDECFDGNTLVLTPTGYVPIKDINVGDKVINYSEDTNEFKVDVVVKQHINLTNSNSEKMYELEFDNGVKIRVTGNHKFLTNLGWCRADELTNEHEIISKT